MAMWINFLKSYGYSLKTRMPETETEHDSKNAIEGLGELWKSRLADHFIWHEKCGGE